MYAFSAFFREFCKIEKILQVQNFLRIFLVAPGKYTGDHRQIMGIMGRSWAVSRVFQKLCPNCIKSLYNHQRRSRPWSTAKTQDLNLIFFNESVIFAQICTARRRSLAVRKHAKTRKIAYNRRKHHLSNKLATGANPRFRHYGV